MTRYGQLLSQFTKCIVYLICTEQVNFDDPSSWEWNMDDLILKVAWCMMSWQRYWVCIAYGEWKCQTLNALISSFHPRHHQSHLPRLLITDLSPPFSPKCSLSPLVEWTHAQPTMYLWIFRYRIWVWEQLRAIIVSPHGAPSCICCLARPFMVRYPFLVPPCARCIRCP